MCGERRFGATLVSAQFGCEPKTALKKSLIYQQANKVKLTFRYWYPPPGVCKNYMT